MSNFESEKPSVYVQSSEKTSQSICSPGAGPTGKRLDYITWHQHHMYMARMLSEMSTSSQPSGCYIVDKEHYQIASEIVFKEDSCQCAIVSALHKLEKKANDSDENFIMYITSFHDCRQCWERISSMKISKIWYWSPSNNSKNWEHEFHAFLNSSGIELAKYTPTRTISIDFQ
ncbi:hypothetical protein CRE_25115 [Caenorhabditis remanei]|uniref:CMP/dCMP-type deaminase domain-containing protein n=1 Tax=Caenorhabditis remanei TaxID=31234 RepID=E3LSZ9_CAERE|nr:hypothetical protein CRE_25115 [Caenorhabditis remanei]